MLVTKVKEAAEKYEEAIAAGLLWRAGVRHYTGAGG